MPLVRVSMFPDKPIEVPESEVAVLRGQGILLEDTPEDPPARAGKKDDPSNKESD
jgi:hypothetical protein